ncbi:MAG: ABC transporter ATP-binding protein [Lachnospiraceae bacterium]
MEIQLIHINKKFQRGFAIRDLNMSIQSEKFTTFLGPSGCGKTTILRMIAGLETPDSGTILLDGKKVFSSDDHIDIAPNERNLAFVFQDFALWPHLTVYENVAFPLRARKDTRDLDRRVRDALATVRLSGMEQRYPGQLSGGQQQRVAFARAIVGKPGCILFDEPLSALDAILREQMREELRDLVARMKTTAVFVTHDQIEAMSMSDDIFVLSDGKIQQEGSPEEIYDHPANSFAARFIGKSNWIGGDRMFRPEAMHLVRNAGDSAYEADIKNQQFVGDGYEVHLMMDGNEWLCRSDERLQGAKVTVYVSPQRITSFA